jgi:S-DNA-T family DNA segregation ATPase FtsK/SpoIIIE
MPTGEFTPIRVQGCFLSDAEVNRITDFIRETCPASYDPGILEELEKLQNDTDAINIPDASADDDYVGGDGSLLTQAIEMTVNDGQVSTSLIQRRLRLGYARAGRLVDEMEKRGIVSQKDGAKPRMCLISREEFEMMKDSGALD